MLARAASAVRLGNAGCKKEPLRVFLRFGPCARLMEKETEQLWWVYLLRSSKGDRSYVGVSCDLDRRLAEHNGERAGGARSTRAGRPWLRVAVVGPLADRARAQRLEAQLKKHSGPKRKEAFERLQAQLEEKNRA